MLLGCAAIFPTPNTLGLPFWGKHGQSVTINLLCCFSHPTHFNYKLNRSITQAPTMLNIKRQ